MGPPPQRAALVNAPRWALIAIWVLEASILVMQLHRRQWTEAMYWFGVMFINVALFARTR